MTDRRDLGFSLIEMAATLLVLGLIAAIGIPVFRGFSDRHRLGGATENIAAQIRIARERAIATGVEQTLYFQLDTLHSDYRLHHAGSVAAVWSLPPGVVYDESPADDLDTLRLERDGRASHAGSIVLVDARGFRDTIGIQRSGLVTTH